MIARVAVLSSLLLAAGASAAETAKDAPAPFEKWPPRDYLLESLLKGLPGIMRTYHADTGRFGTEPWTCMDQNRIYTLAAAWSINDDKNPYYHDPKLLEAIAKGGEVLVDEMDANGKWTFRKKDNSTWGQIHMPWTYSRWIRAYEMTRDSLPAASRAKWEKGLKLGYGKLAQSMPKMRVHNIPTHHGMGLYIAGRVFRNPEWQKTGANMMHRAVEHQDPGGYWSENFGPVVTYNRVYVEALGLYYHYSHDPKALDALSRSARFHSAILYPDGSAASAIDERVVYHPGVDKGNVGFSWTPEGRGFLISQFNRLRDKRERYAAAEYAATMLLYGGSGDSIAPPTSGAQGTVALGDNDAVIRRQKPWQWVFSGYATKPIDNRWIQDRQNLVEVFHDVLGVVAGGGNTKLQPYWSTFTVGDPSLLAHKPGETHPDFTPDIDLLWTPDAAEIAVTSEATEMRLKYGDVPCTVKTEMLDDRRLRLTYSAPKGRNAEAHLPLVRHASVLKTAKGDKVRLAGDKPVVLTKADLGDWFEIRELRVSVPDGATLRWPALQHNPYARDGKAPIGNAKIVLAMPFDAVDSYTVDLAYTPAPPFPGIVYDARHLPVEGSEKAFTKPLDSLKSVLLGRCPIGESLTFTISDIAPGTYEFYGDFILAPMYGTVEISIDGQKIGKPFDAYAPSIDTAADIVKFGTVTLGKGPHQLKMQIVAKNPASQGNIVSVKRWLFKPVANSYPAP